MGKANKGIFDQIADFIYNNPLAREFARPGCCRMWSGQSLQLLRNSNGMLGEYEAEAREVTLPDGISHTFLRISIDGENYIMDGTGVNKRSPYFGSEGEAPTYLLNSIPDRMINAQEDFAHPLKER